MADGPLRHIAAVGVVAGGCGALKLTGMAVAVALCVPLAAILLGGACANRRDACRRFAVFAGTAAGIALPFYLRPFLATGNPLFPYFAGLFTDDTAVLAMSDFHHAIGAYRFGARSVAMFVTAPILLCFGTEVFDGSYGWQLVALLALAAMHVAPSLRNPQTRPRCVLLTAVAVWLYMFWFFTAQQARFLVPVLVPLLCVAAPGLAALSRKRQAGIAILALTVLSLPTERGRYYFHSWARIAAAGRMVDYVHSVTDGNYVPAVHAVHDLTPENARLMLVFEHRSLYLARPSVVGTPFFQSAYFTPPDTVSDPGAAHATLTGTGVTHVLVSLEARGPDQLPDYLERCQGFFGVLLGLEQQGGLVRVWQSEHHILYQVAPLQAVERPEEDA